MLEKIKQESIEALGVRSLPTSPTSPYALGGGYSAEEMKMAFDRLSLHIIEHYNRLIDTVHAESETSITAEMPTGLFEDHTLADLILDIISGGMVHYMRLGNRSIAEEIYELKDRVLAIEGKL